ncbi:MAG: T9SS type A sorting domain-containing protein, partial [Bacteroidaceae bacterium]|nr:T9SS type A sorting domain-containing protein [Bacteroidaceae bacterium]
EKSDHISIKRTHGGMLIISLTDSNARDRYTLNIYSADGKRLSSRQFQKATTLNTQGMKGIYFIRVEGNGMSQGISIGI